MPNVPKAARQWQPDEQHRQGASDAVEGGGLTTLRGWVGAATDPYKMRLRRRAAHDLIGHGRHDQYLHPRHTCLACKGEGVTPDDLFTVSLIADASARALVDGGLTDQAAEAQAIWEHPLPSCPGCGGLGVIPGAGQ